VVQSCHGHLSRCLGLAYEGTFLVAVASAYFLALNALAAFLFLQGVRLRDDVRALQVLVASARPQAEELASLASLALERGAETLKSAKEEMAA